MRQISSRLARRQGRPSSQGLRHTRSCRSLHPTDARIAPPKPITPASTIAHAAGEFIQARHHNPNTPAALKAITKAAGHRPASELNATILQAIVASWHHYSQHTRATYTKLLRCFVLWLEEIAGAPPGLHRAIPKNRQPGPRLTIATPAERNRLLAYANPAMRFFLLLCAELGLRHRTAASICLRNYTAETQSITFTTKGRVQQTLPVTPEIAAIFEALPADVDPDRPVVSILHTGKSHGSRPRFTKAWTRLKEVAGVRADLRIHDLRRTVAEDIWAVTRDLRIVQAQLGHRSPTTTARYLADRITLAELTPVLQQVQAHRLQQQQKEKPN